MVTVRVSIFGWCWCLQMNRSFHDMLDIVFLLRRDISKGSSLAILWVLNNFVFFSNRFDSKGFNMVPCVIIHTPDQIVGFWKISPCISGSWNCTGIMFLRLQASSTIVWRRTTKSGWINPRSQNMKVSIGSPGDKRRCTLLQSKLIFHKPLLPPTRRAGLAKAWVPTCVARKRHVVSTNHDVVHHGFVFWGIKDFPRDPVRVVKCRWATAPGAGDDRKVTLKSLFPPWGNDLFRAQNFTSDSRVTCQVISRPQKVTLSHFRALKGPFVQGGKGQYKASFGDGQLSGPISRDVAILSLWYPNTARCFSREAKHSPELVQYPPWYLVSHRHICHIPFCDVSRDNCAIPHKDRYEWILPCYRYKHRAIWKVLLLGL